MKKGVVKEKIFFEGLILFLGIILTISFVFAAHVVKTSADTTAYSVNEDVGFVYNISVNNTDGTAPMNITYVNITIPSTFTFLAFSNGTNASITNNFTNTSTVLSWTNLTGLVMHLSKNYFWFNATASTPGIYNLTVTTRNSTTSYSTNITITINDTTLPVVTLISPANLTSASTNEYNFTFNVTDVDTSLSCKLILDDSPINVLTSVNISGGTNGMYNSSLSVAAHTWSVNCTDTAGNVGKSLTRTLTVSAVPVVATSTTGSGGVPTFSPKTTELENGYKKSMLEDWKISFKVANESHLLNIEDITETTAVISISSNTQRVTLLVGQEKKFELSGDNYYDVLVQLNSIDPTNKAYPKAGITVKTIHEEIVSQIQQPVADETEEETVQTSPEEKDLGTGKSTSANWLWALIIPIIIILVIALVVISISYKKKSRK